MRHDTGEVLDFVGGQADLEAKVIRAIGEPGRRFAEDKLRMMRAVRFAARFGFEIEAETFRAIRARRRDPPSFPRAPPRRTHQTSYRRRGPEGVRIAGRNLAPPASSSGSRGDERRRAASAISSRRGRVDSHADDARRASANASSTLAWGVLLHDVGKPPTFQSAAETGTAFVSTTTSKLACASAEAICGRLRFSNEDTEQILALVDNQ